MTTTRGMSSDEPKTSQAAGDAYALFLVSLFLVVTVGLVAQVHSITVGLFVTEIFLIFLPAVLYVRLKRLPLVQALRWRPVSPGIALRAAILGVSAWGMAIIIGLAASKLIGTALGPPPTLPEHWLPTTGSGFGIYLLVGSALAGVCEETLFRGAIQGTLEKGGAWKGMGVTALLFAIYHVNPWEFLPILAVGLLLGFITLRTDSTLPAMISHACINVVGLTMAFVYRDEHESLFSLLAGVLAFLFLAALAEFVRRTRGSERRLSPLTEVPGGLPRQFTRIAGGGGACDDPVGHRCVRGLCQTLSHDKRQTGAGD